MAYVHNTAAGGASSGGLTDTQLRATPVPVSGTVAVSTAGFGASVTNFPAAFQIASGSANIGSILALTDGTQRLESGGAVGAAIPARALQLGGSDGTLLRALSTDTSGRPNIIIAGGSIANTSFSVGATILGGSIANTSFSVGATILGGNIANVAFQNASGSAQLGFLGAGSAVIGSIANTSFSVGATLLGGSIANTAFQVASGSATIGLLAANQSVNTAQINAVVPLMGNGVTGTGSQRVTVASDNTAFPVNAIQSTAAAVGGAWPAKITDGTNVGAVKAASAIAAATDPAQVVQDSPQDPRAATLCVTATGAAAAAVTNTLPAAAAGLFHYITRINIVKYASVATVGAAAPTIVTSTNLTGTPAWTTPTALAVGTQYESDVEPKSPIKSSVAATNTTIVGPATTGIIWRITVYYYTAP